MCVLDTAVAATAAEMGAKKSEVLDIEGSDGTSLAARGALAEAKSQAAIKVSLFIVMVW